MSGFELPNTTPVPNEIINGWMQRLKGSELKVLLLVVRKTLGWIADKKTGMRKEEDWLSYKQLKFYTGLSSRPLSSAIDALVGYKLIQIRDKKGNELETKESRQAIGRKRLRLYYRLNLNTLEHTSHYFQEHTSLQSKPVPTTLQKSSALVYKVKTTKSNTLQNQIPLSNYSKIEDLKNEDLQEIADKYGFPLAFVKSKYDDMFLWAGSKPGAKQKGRNWKLTLMRWVKSDGIKVVEKEKNMQRFKKGGFVDASV